MREHKRQPTQIVCGITTSVIGTVAIIQEKGYFNLAFGIPAGGVTIIAAAFSIYSSRGFDGYQPSTNSNRKFYLLPKTFFWFVACVFQSVLIIRIFITILRMEEEKDELIIIAAIELCLAVVISLAVVLILYIDCKYDPD